MQQNFSTALCFVLEHEGGYVDNPRDPGGPTKYGVTIATLSHELGRGASLEDVRNLTPEQAGEIYRKKYWNAIGGDHLPAGVDLIAFDIAVNMGVGRALSLLAQTQHLPARQRVEALDKRRCGFYRALRGFPVFGSGWLRREREAFALASHLALA